MEKIANQNTDLHNRIARLTPPGHLIVPNQNSSSGRKEGVDKKIKLITTHKYIISMVNN